MLGEIVLILSFISMSIKKHLKILIIVLLTAIISGSLVYWWQNNKLQKLEIQVISLQEQNNGLYKTISILENQITEYTKNENCEPGKTYKNKEACICDGEWLDLSIYPSPAEVGPSYMFICNK